MKAGLLTIVLITSSICALVFFVCYSMLIGKRKDAISEIYDADAEEQQLNY